MHAEFKAESAVRGLLTPWICCYHTRMLMWANKMYKFDLASARYAFETYGAYTLSQIANVLDLQVLPTI